MPPEARTVMSESPVIPISTARPRLRSAVTTVLMIMIAVMIVRDIFVRRWSSVALPASDVTQRPQ